ncbi:upper zone of growth plate and cartilage matrix associated a [Notolabrus celidotus]|uniref:upper zone of growth plate and cartilage matrix associated a n=1 Tax=Notolabrus celidotus TaxID=1203425 RepID=UPI00148F8828|nr:upper zone of growth plate and cartilage matrix associated a [Notolabrus celidotus]
MSWTRVFVLSSLSVLLILTFSSVVENAAVKDNSKAGDPKGVERQLFMKESEASNFFKRRSRRSPQYYNEYLAEQRVRLAKDEQRREYNEEQRDEFENYVEEERDEQDERTREKSEQFREFHYDGQYPRYHWFH